jgi:serine/threonine protein kinase
MGTVFRATQTEPVQRSVALKMIKTGLADAAMLARFMAERQAMALMDHPDIARIYDAGSTASGIPYFAMEYCQGLPIDQYCNENRLGIESRIQLIVRIARAVQRAHNHGIIHRDLKPENILVSDCEGRPNLKVIDFGIAKFTDKTSECPDESATRIGEMIGTPAYMSPEQAAGASIDGRTDVFAIGAILFNLLTGSTPLPPPPIPDPSLADVLLHIQSFQATTPSRRVASLDSNAIETLASNVALSNVKQWRSSVKGDLDWITLRATEADRIRRYATPDDFADDLQRFLNHEPTNAAAPSRLYRFKKFYQRRKAGVIATAAIGLTIATASGIGGLSWYQYDQEVRRENVRVADEASMLLKQADESRDRASLGGPQSDEEFTSAQTAIAKAESLLSTHPEMKPLALRLANLQAEIRHDLAALQLVDSLNDARERATQVDTSRSGDAFGKVAGLDQITSAFSGFGIDPLTTDPSPAASRLANTPTAVRKKLIETLDFVIGESPINVGLYLHHQGGRVTIAEIVDGGAAARSGQIRLGDRVLAINDVDLVSTYSNDEVGYQAYALMSGEPGKTITMTLVREASQPFESTLVCRGELAYWSRDVLAILDKDPWRTRLRDSVLRCDLTSLQKLAESDQLFDQPPFNLIQLSGSLFMLERTNDAIRFLEVAQQRHPENFWANHYLGTALATAHQPPRPEESIRYLTAAVALRPQSIGARVNLGEGLARLGDQPGSQRQLSVAAAMAPAERSLQERLVGIEPASNTSEGKSEQSDEPQQSEQSQQQHDQSTGSNSTRDAYSARDPLVDLEIRARELAQAGQRAAAFELVSQAESELGSQPILRRIKGSVLLDLGDYTAARIVLSDAARLAPTDAAARFYHGVALQYSGNSRAAASEYEAALKIRPDYDAVHEFLDPLNAANTP